MKAVLYFLLALFTTPLSSAIQEVPTTFPWQFVEIAILETDLAKAGVGGFLIAATDSSGNTCLVSTPRRPFRGIHQFDVHGQWQGNLGRAGPGPGEFQAVNQLAVAPNGDLLVYDSFSGWKITHIKADGSYVISFQSPGIQPRKLAFADIDRYWISSTHPSIAGFFEPWEWELKLVTGSGEEIWAQKEDQISADLLLQIDDRPGAAMPYPNPAERNAKWTVDNEGSAWIITPDFDRLFKIDSNGNKTVDLNLKLPPKIYQGRSWQQFIEAWTERLRQTQNDASRRLVRAVEEALRSLDGHVAPVQRFWWIDEVGFLVERSPVNMRSEHWFQRPATYLALFPDGSISEEVQRPGGLVSVSNGYALALRSPLDELPILVLYRIEPTG